MTAARTRLASETFAFECNGLRYLATVSRFGRWSARRAVREQCESGLAF